MTSNTNEALYNTEDVTLPSGLVATVREMTGREEDLLSNETLMKGGKAIDMLLQNVTLKLEGSRPTDKDVLELSSQDRVALIVHSRKLTYGPEVETEVTCGECNAKFDLHVDLNELEVVPSPEETDIQVVLSDNTKVTLKNMNGADERRLQQVIQQGNDRITSLLLVHIREVEGKKANQYRPWLQGLRLADRRKLRAQLDKFQFGYKVQVACNCPSCNTENKINITSTAGFFFPEEE